MENVWRMWRSGESALTPQQLRTKRVCLREWTNRIRSTVRVYEAMFDTRIHHIRGLVLSIGEDMIRET